MKARMHTTRISLPEREREEVVALLNKTLASASDLFLQLKHAHWNLKGPEFIALHLMFDDLAEKIEEHVDIIAERITSLGGTALGTSQAIVENTQLRTYPTDIFSAKDHIEHLAHNFAILGENSRNNIEKSEEFGDIATGDLYIAFTRLLDKSLWFIEAHVQK
jgi:starvation-inducible DNA-binding protein